MKCIPKLLKISIKDISAINLFCNHQMLCKYNHLFNVVSTFQFDIHT